MSNFCIWISLDFTSSMDTLFTWECWINHSFPWVLRSFFTGICTGKRTSVYQCFKPDSTVFILSRWGHHMITEIATCRNLAWFPASWMDGVFLGETQMLRSATESGECQKYERLNITCVLFIRRYLHKIRFHVFWKEKINVIWKWCKWERGDLYPVLEHAATNNFNHLPKLNPEHKCKIICLL